MIRILLVEDNDDLRNAIHELLSRNYTVVEAENGKIAQNTLLNDGPFDLIICDAQMPVMGGVDFLEWSRQQKPTPFILMTGYSELLDSQRTFELDANNVIIKPFMNSDLLGAVEEVLSQSSSGVTPKKIKAV